MFSSRSIVWLMMLVCAACTPKPLNPDQDLFHAMSSVVSDISNQLGVPTGPRTTIIDPLLDARAGQQTGASQKVQEELTKAMPAIVKGMQIVPFNDEGAANSRYVANGTVTAMPEKDRFRMSIALSDRTSGLVIAQSVALFTQPGLSAAPTRFYADSPSLTRDRSVDGYLRTAETPPGAPADALYIEQVPTAALLSEALEAYNAQKWDVALARYEAAMKRPDGQQMRTLNGLYLCYVQLGRLADAENAFDKIATLGLATNNLAIKLLFRPGRVDFWPDPKVSGLYPMWLKHIAKAIRDGGTCLNIVGHTSKSGTDSTNDKLSLARATSIRDWLEREAPGITAKSHVNGVGSRETIIGTGSDDATDALDRRVEFRVVPCQ